MSGAPIKPGPTGHFPRGKLHPADEGELAIGIAHDSQGVVHINFGTPMSVLSLPQQNAIGFARLLLRHAGATKVEITLGEAAEPASIAGGTEVVS